MRGEANSTFALKLYMSMAETGINSGARRARVGGDSASSYVAGNMRVDTENSNEGNSLSRVGISRSEAGARRVRTRADSRTKADSRQGYVGSLSPGHKLGNCVVKRLKFLATYQAMISMKGRPERP